MAEASDQGAVAGAAGATGAARTLTAQALDGIAGTTAENIRAFLDGRRGRELENVVLASPR